MRPACLPVDLTCENLIEPLGIGELRPRLSWRLQDERPGARQTACRIQAASSIERLDKRPDWWDTGKAESGECLDIEYAGKKLGSRAGVFWRVKVWDHQGAESEWSRPAYFEIGLLNPKDWTADWITLPRSDSDPCPCLRRVFRLKAAPVRARLHVTGLGLFETWLNGKRVGGDYFTPGWTDYGKRIHVLTYDVTPLLKTGDNAAGAMLGKGWFSGRLGWNDKKNLYGDELVLRCQLEVILQDGSSETIISDTEWKGRAGPVLDSDFYDGETHDGRRELPGWTETGFNDADWARVSAADSPKGRLLPMPHLPVRRQERLTPEKQTEPAAGVHVFDLGQNMVGWARVRFRGNQAGDRVTLRFAEMLNSDGTLYTKNLRSAKATDTYICAGPEETVWEPRFTFHGFRFVELSGLRETPRLPDVEGVVLHSAMAATGTFECSNTAVNRLQKNIQWGQKGNFLEAPTDCPQRDERLGWTGDAQVFARTACFNRNVSAFFEKWCADIADARFPDGSIPHVVPDVLRRQEGRKDDWGNVGGAAAWADAAVICPWTVYCCYGNRRILERSYETMRGFVEWRVKTSKHLIHSSALFGDWLAIDMAENDPGKTPTPRDLIATAYFARTAEILARTAEILKKRNDAKKYAVLHRKIKAVFAREFVSPSGRIVGDTQTGYLLALGFDLVPAKCRAHAVERLVADLEARKWHLSTGFVGTPLLMPVLFSAGRTDAAYRLLLQDTYPSWLYTVAQGATTMWERWNSWTKDKGFGDASMNSFNHYAYGAVGEWLYATVAGLDLDPEEPGYRHILFRPEPGGNLSFAKAELKTRYGLVRSGWKIEKNRTLFEFTVPPNTRATIRLPGRKAIHREAGSHCFTLPWKGERAL